jgi:hypothetical protein
MAKGSKAVKEAPAAKAAKADSTEVDYTKYLTKEPTDLHIRFADWIKEKTGLTFATKKDEAAFLRAVALSVYLRIPFQSSPENQAALEAAKTDKAARDVEKAAAKSAVKAEKASAKKAAAKTEAEAEEAPKAAAKAPAKKAPAAKGKATAKATATEEATEAPAEEAPAPKQRAAAKPAAAKATRPSGKGKTAPF